MSNVSKKKTGTATQGTHPVRRITPLFNEVFIRVFGSMKSQKLTQGLINAILREAGLEEIDKIDSIVDSIEAEYTDIGGSIDCKSSRYDVRIVSGNHILDLEAQQKPENIAERSLFYASKILTSSMQTGQKYSEIPHITIITLLNAPPLFPESDKYIHVCNLRWEENGIFAPATDKQCFVLVELWKVSQRYNELSEDVLSSEALSWMYLLTRGFAHEKEVQAMVNAFPTMEEFAEQYGFAIGDPKTVQAYELYEENWREEQSMKDYLERLKREASEEAHTKGLAEGRAEGKREIIFDLVADGLLSVEQAAQRFGIAVEETPVR